MRVAGFLVSFPYLYRGCIVHCIVFRIKSGRLAFVCFYLLALLYFALACSYSILAGAGLLATVCLSITSTRIVLCNLALVPGGVGAG